MKTVKRFKVFGASTESCVTEVSDKLVGNRKSRKKHRKILLNMKKTHSKSAFISRELKINGEITVRHDL
jgi:hypothetical protein